jgi:hypothetical protein
VDVEAFAWIQSVQCVLNRCPWSVNRTPPGTSAAARWERSTCLERGSVDPGGPTLGGPPLPGNASHRAGTHVQSTGGGSETGISLGGVKVPVERQPVCQLRGLRGASGPPVNRRSNARSQCKIPRSLGTEHLRSGRRPDTSVSSSSSHSSSMLLCWTYANEFHYSHEVLSVTPPVGPTRSAPLAFRFSATGDLVGWSGQPITDCEATPCSQSQIGQDCHLRR